MCVYSNKKYIFAAQLNEEENAIKQDFITRLPWYSACLLCLQAYVEGYEVQTRIRTVHTEGMSQANGFLHTYGQRLLRHREPYQNRILYGNE